MRQLRLGSGDGALQLLAELLALRVLPRGRSIRRLDGREGRLDALVLDVQTVRGDVELFAFVQQRRKIFGRGA